MNSVKCQNAHLQAIHFFLDFNVYYIHTIKIHAITFHFKFQVKKSINVCQFSVSMLAVIAKSYLLN